MFKKMSFVLALSGSALLLCPLSYAEIKTTTVETTTQAVTTPPPETKPVVTTTTVNTTTTSGLDSRKLLDEDTLKKFSSNLCTEGFKAFILTDNRNVCRYKASSPDVSYSCVWQKQKAAVYPPSENGPCNLNFIKHRGSVVINTHDYPSNPPLLYGVEAQCCVIPEKGL